MSYKIVNENHVGLVTLNKWRRILYVSYINSTGKTSLWYDKGCITKGVNFYFTGTYCFSGARHFGFHVNVLEQI